MKQMNEPCLRKNETLLFLSFSLLNLMGLDLTLLSLSFFYREEEEKEEEEEEKKTGAR